MQPLRIDRVGAPEPVVVTNGKVASTNGNGHVNGNGKSRKSKPIVVATEAAETPVLVEVGG